MEVFRIAPYTSWVCLGVLQLVQELLVKEAPRNHNTPVNETENSPVAHVAAAERPAPAARTGNKREEGSDYKFQNADNWSYI
ncbi:hypothetical protein L3Y34_000440 [Caenorhabditis briggsae]|uniref:Uncharacterized protein n=1 Tax=Caenorhabditis briggsae TaxID=6238 RepID=A0AAE9INK0_CAEBR|nr:hypothetical protein L3Y34_000440 [Caenorhabditis briggsae]